MNTPATRAKYSLTGQDPARVIDVRPLAGTEHRPGGFPCDGSYCVVDAWHGTCYTHKCAELWTWSCWQESCVRAWAQRHAGCHVEVNRGLTG